MSGGIKLRVGAFILAIAAMVAVIAWTAYSSWVRTGELSERLSVVQFQSFQIADQFQQSILEQDNLVLRYAAYGDTNAWTIYEIARTNLNQWIAEERPKLQTRQEKQILDAIDTAYDDYMAASSNIHVNTTLEGGRERPLAELAGFEKQSQRMQRLSLELAGAHQESMDAFLAASDRSLSYLRYFLVGSLALLLAAVGGLAAVVYRELIAPLRVRLVQNEALIERQEKLASLGMLAAGVAHEIRNPLTAIKAWLFIQQKHLQPGSPEHTDAQIIGDEVTRLERIVKDVLLFARPSEPQLETVPADAPLRQVAMLLGPQLEKPRIRLTLESGVAAKIRIDPQQFQQVLINLVQNAADSIGQDGTVNLRVRVGTSRLGDQSKEVVILEVADTGKGISPEVERRLFDPFFTTKERGTGLGLSIAARIVEKHGGALQYQTQVNRGTIFGIVLPRVN